MPRPSSRARRAPRKSAGAGLGGLDEASAIRAFEDAAQRRDYPTARKLLEAQLARNPRWASAKIAYAQLLHESYGEVDRPIALLEESLPLAPNDSRVLNLLATMLFSANRREAALEAAERAMARFPEVPDSYQIMQRAKPELGASLRGRIETVLAERVVTDRQRLVFHTVLGRIAEHEGDAARFFAEFRRANALQKGVYDPREIVAYFREMTESFSPAYFERIRGYGASDARPVFVLGMPRSGSTLLERILSRHARIDTGGERSDLLVVSEALRAEYGAPAPGRPGAARFMSMLSRHEAKAAGARYAELIRPSIATANAARWLDKMPGNFILIGLIRTVLPNARIIHARRNPIDVALSCFTQSFRSGHAYARSLETLAHYIALHRRLMAHWRATLGDALIEIDYEDVVADLEGQARRGVAALGLDWDPACLAPQDSNRPVITASVAQVRQPIYRSSVARWRRYEAELAPLFETWRAMGDDVYQDVMSAARSRA